MKLPCKPFDSRQQIPFRYAHIKRDGHYLNISRNGNGQVFCFTSHPHDIAYQLAEFLPQWKTLCNLPYNVSILGELWKPGCKASDVKTAIKHHDSNLSFHAFAIDNWPGFNRFEIERMPLEQVSEIMKGVSIPFIPFVAIKQSDPFKHINQLITSDSNTDIEGIVFKDSNLANWHKWKPRKTIDLVVTGFQPGTGKYLNQLGALIVSAIGNDGAMYEVANVSGMTDVQRRYMSANNDKILGTVIEVEYQDVGNNGRLRHPSFVRVRDDKQASACNVSQDPDLCQYWRVSLPLFKE